MKTKDTEALRRWDLNQARSKPNPVDWPVRTACDTVHHYNSTQLCGTEIILLIVPFLQTSHLYVVKWRKGQECPDSVKDVNTVVINPVIIII